MSWSPVNACKFGAATGSDWPHKSLGEWNRASLRLVGRVFILRPLFCARAERAASLELRRSRVDTSTTLLSPPASVDLYRAESCTENGSWPAVKPPLESGCDASERDSKLVRRQRTWRSRRCGC